MADNVTVSNSPTSVNTDIPVRTIDKAGEQTQVVAIDWAGSGTEDLTSPDFATETTLQSINAAIAGGLYFNITTNSDILGVSVTGRRNNEIELSFFDSFNSDLITNTTVNIDRHMNNTLFLPLHLQQVLQTRFNVLVFTIQTMALLLVMRAHHLA